MIEEIELNDIGTMEVYDKDDTGKPYVKTIKFLGDSVRITFHALFVFATCSNSAQIVYLSLLNQLGKYEYELEIGRNVIKSITNLSDASVSRAIKELESKQLLKVVGKDVYHFPINKCVKGNVNTIIQREEKKQEELLAMKKEREAIDRITKFSLKLRSKPLIKNQSNENKD